MIHACEKSSPQLLPRLKNNQDVKERSGPEVPARDVYYTKSALVTKYPVNAVVKNHGFSKSNGVVHIHVKDATWMPAKNDADYNWPGEGQGRVRDILKDALARGYIGGLSIEPHMLVVFDDAASKANDDSLCKNFVEYGRRLERLIAEVG